MKKVFLIAGVAALLAVTMVAGGRANNVRHFYDDGSYKEFLSSEGNCRHHLTAHPLDLVATAGGWIHDAAFCN